MLADHAKGGTIMKKERIKVAAGSVPLALADPVRNAETIIARMQEADAAGVDLLVLPELCLTGCSCGDLFFSELLLDAARNALARIIDASAGLSLVTAVGIPLLVDGRRYDCAAVVSSGQLLGMVPKTRLDHAQLRYFSTDGIESKKIHMGAMMDVPFGRELIFDHPVKENCRFGVALGQDGTALKQMRDHGAKIILNPAAVPELIGAKERTCDILTAVSAQYACLVVRAGADVTESTGDVVYGSHHVIVVAGEIVAESTPFVAPALLCAETDIGTLSIEGVAEEAPENPLDPPRRTLAITPLRRTPFVPTEEETLAARAEEILNIQAQGLARRLSHTYAKTAVIGISGGLDSTLALLVAVRAMDLLQRPHTDILAVTMPCFGTTGRTKSNATLLCEGLDVTLKEINLKASVLSHFADIGQREDNYDVTYENAQARERTQVLMDLANMTGGLVIGTGDLSELALGWATYNGDHMSMYGVNGGLPKTLIRHVVAHVAKQSAANVAAVLYDILDTPVSPELLPADAKGDIAQKTEDLVGPYELHDFFLYYMVRHGASPKTIYNLARTAFAGVYEDGTILHWLRTFHRRFFAQQFKRSCLPDGPAVGSVSFSPRGVWMMPSDACRTLWERQLDELSKK